ncbi:MAG TPA: iron-containing redox enzyme family protein [Stellaceae bacterium]|nr:iron-containing redox enzyme family protein [Stellaceae bacterium]
MASVTDEIVAIRDRWHTKNHPFFRSFGEGKLPLKSLGRYLALHYQFVSRALPSIAVLYARVYEHEDVRKAIAENIAEEEGLKAIPGEGHKPHDHNEMIFRFCKAAGFSADEVRNIKMTPAWWARSLHYATVTTTEPLGVVLAMQSTQEGQQPALNDELVLPAFEKHYGYKRSAPEVEFFAEHAVADIEHSRRQLELCAKHLTSPELRQRALKVAQEAVELRWASITDIYRADVLGERDLLPAGVA